MQNFRFIVETYQRNIGDLHHMKWCIGRALGLGTFTLIAKIFQYFNENVNSGRKMPISGVFYH